MDNRKDTNLIFRIIEYGMNKEVFSYPDLRESLKIDPQDTIYIFDNCIVKDSTDANTNRIMYHIAHKTEEDGFKEPLYRILPNAIFQYTDYLEIKEARINAEDARRVSNESLKYSKLALWITLGIGLISIVIQVYADIVKSSSN